MASRDKLRRMKQRLDDALLRVQQAGVGLASIEALADLARTRDALLDELRADLGRAERSGDSELTWGIRDFMRQLEGRQ
jgi:hypothetical protein